MDYQLWLAKGSFLGNENGRANKKDTRVKMYLYTMYPHNLVFQLTDITFLVGDTREPVCAVRAVLAARFLATLTFGNVNPIQQRGGPPLSCFCV